MPKAGKSDKDRENSENVEERNLEVRNGTQGEILYICAIHKSLLVVYVAMVALRPLTG